MTEKEKDEVEESVNKISYGEVVLYIQEDRIVRVEERKSKKL